MYPGVFTKIYTSDLLYRSCHILQQDRTFQAFLKPNIDVASQTDHLISTASTRTEISLFKRNGLQVGVPDSAHY